MELAVLEWYGCIQKNECLRIPVNAVCSIRCECKHIWRCNYVAYDCIVLQGKNGITLKVTLSSHGWVQRIVRMGKWYIDTGKREQFV